MKKKKKKNTEKDWFMLLVSPHEPETLKEIEYIIFIIKILSLVIGLRILII